MFCLSTSLEPLWRPRVGIRLPSGALVATTAVVKLDELSPQEIIVGIEHSRAASFPRPGEAYDSIGDRIKVQEITS